MLVKDLKRTKVQNWEKQSLAVISLSILQGKRRQRIDREVRQHCCLVRGGQVLDDALLLMKAFVISLGMLGSLGSQKDTTP